MTKSIKTSVIIAFFGLFFNGLVSLDMPQLFQASIIQDGDDTGVKVYYEDFSDGGRVGDDAGDTTGLDETQITGKNLVQKIETISQNLETPYSSLLNYTYDPDFIAVSNGKASLKFTSLWEGLVAYWHMDETKWQGQRAIIDSSDNANNASGGNGQSTVGGGKIGRAGTFDGSNDVVDTGVLNNAVNTLTFSTWIQPTNAGTILDNICAERIVSQQRDDIATETRIALGLNNDKVAVCWYDGSDHLIEGTTTLSSSSWYHVALTYDGTNIRLYVNGVQENSATTTGLSTASSLSNIELGRKADSTRYFTGLMDEFAIHDHALRAVDIEDMYNAGSGTVFIKYPTNSPTIVKSAEDTDPYLVGFTGFVETLGTNNAGPVRYQVSEDALVWEFWNGSQWAVASGAIDYNTATVINMNINSFAPATGKIYTKAFLISNGTQAVEIDKLTLQADVQRTVTSSTEILGPILTSDSFDYLEATVSNESGSMRYLNVRILDTSFFPLNIGGRSVFDTSDLPLDLSSVTQDTIYIEFTFHNTGTNIDSVRLHDFSVGYSNLPENFTISKSASVISGTSNIEYTIIVQSTGGDDWDVLSVTDVLNPDLKYINTSDSGITAGGQVVDINFTNAELSSGSASKSFIVEVLPSGETRPQICNFVTGTIDGVSIFISNQSCTTIAGGSSGVDGNFDINLSSSVISGTRDINYTFTVTNTGGYNWTQFKVVNVLDPDLLYIGSVDTGILQSDQAIYLFFTSGDISTGTASKTFTTRIRSGVEDRTTMCNFATGSSDGIDVFFSNQVCDGIPFFPVCGNGMAETGEFCDDGNTTSGDGCNALCQSEDPVCGNSMIDTGETCDDGNITSGDGCSAMCQLEGCGNNILDTGEQCDDGNTASGDGCNASCQTESCGNDILDAGEQCDDGNTTAGDGCSATCQTEQPVCGNNNIESGEICDDGNTTSGDGCSATCQAEGCGNNVLDTGEQCDDGNALDGDGCNSSCQNEVCGNTILDTGEQCDDGNTLSSDGCSASCVLEVWACGDGKKEGLEQCDDGNTVSGDGCSASCSNVESGWGCTENLSGLSICREKDNDFALSMSATPIAGTDKITYAVTLQKLGGNNWDDFTVTDVLNSDLSYVGGSSTGVSFSSQVVTLTYHLSDFSTSDTVTKSFNAQVHSSGLDRDKICNFAFGSHDDVSVYISNKPCTTIAGGGNSVNASFDITGTSQVNDLEEFIEYRFVIENVSGTSWSTFIMTDVLPDELEYVRGNHSGISSNGQIVSLIFNKSNFSGNTLEKSFVTRAKTGVPPRTLVCNFAWGSADQGEVVTFADQLCNATPDKNAALSAAIVREIGAEDAAGKADSRIPGSQLGAAPLTVEQANQPIAPKIIYDEKGNVTQILPGKLDPLALAERLMNTPRPTVNRLGTPTALKESAPKEVSSDPLANVQKAPARSLDKNYSSAQASYNLREQRQQEWTDDYQQWLEIVTQDLEAIEESPQQSQEESFEVLEEVTAEILTKAPVIAQKTETIDVSQGEQLILATEGLTETSQQVGLDIPAGLLSGLKDISVEMKVLDMGELPVTASVEGGEKLIIGAVLEINASEEGKSLTQFEKPITMSMSYDPLQTENIDPQTLQIHYQNEATGNWEALPEARMDTATNTIYAQTDHFSFFTVLGSLFTDVSESEYVQYKSSVAPDASSYKDLVQKTKDLASQKELEEAQAKYASKKKIDGPSYEGMASKYQYVDPKKALGDVQGVPTRVPRGRFLDRVTYPTQRK